MRPVRIGVIGCGVISASHLKLAAACPEAEVVAVADPVGTRARERAEEFDITTVYASDEELLRDDRVEAVILALPTGVRTPVANRALEAGMHVLLEKPVASSADEVARFIDLAGDRVVACCSSRMSFSGHAEAAMRCVASGTLGEIRHVRVRAAIGAEAEPKASPPPWRQSMKLNGGGILVNWGCYDLDYVMQITAWALIPIEVSACWWPLAAPMGAYATPGSDADSHYLAMIRCDGGAAITMERAEFASSASDEAWEIIGTEATLHLPMKDPANRPNEVILDRFVPGEGIVSETLWTKADGGPDDNVVADFAGAIRHGRPPRTGMAQALTMQRITDAVYLSQETGRSVRLPTD